MLHCFGARPISFYLWPYRYQCQHLLLHLRTFITDSAPYLWQNKALYENYISGASVSRGRLSVPRCDNRRGHFRGISSALQ